MVEWMDEWMRERKRKEPIEWFDDAENCQPNPKPI